MAGSATLDSTILVDDLVPTIDEVRELQHEFGIRPFRLFAVTRTYTGGTIGLGAFTDVAEELAPRPKVHEWGSPGFRLLACGQVESFDVAVTEVSLNHSYADLMAPALAANQQFFLRLSEAYGQGQPDRYFVHAKPPQTDREKTLGWQLRLKVVQVSA